MISLFEYLKHIFLYPGRKVFLDEGIGIEARYARCKKFWDKHLLCSKSFINEVLKERQYQTIAVLGAGTLLDIDLEVLSHHAGEIHLFDANPRAKKFWPKKINSTRVVSHIEDITGCFNVLINKKVIIEDELAPPHLGSFDVVISLNLLSQLSVMLQAMTLNQYSEEELSRVSQYVERSHIESLKQSAREKIIILYDERFLTYTYEISEWEVAPSLHINVADFFVPWIPSHTSQWLWHVAPQGIEHHEYGVFHDVRAVALRRP